ncbi:MAG TPA: hypothetical protein VL137_16095, partial [Polyangiaceae bacterium]|nr:hypothetical protein [Polyangiaceae bacterium]
MKHALWPMSLFAASCFAVCSCSSDTNKDTAPAHHTTSSGGATHSMPPASGSMDASSTTDGSVSDQDSGPMQAASASQGCGIPTDILGDTPTLQQVAVNLNDGGMQDRSYYLRLPPTYDNTRPYTLVLLGPGCGADGRSVVPIQTASGEDAIIVGLNGADQCFHTGNGADSPDVAYFDATLADLKAKYCIDTHKVFMAGF